jgi:hypothetical protein
VGAGPALALKLGLVEAGAGVAVAHDRGGGGVALEDRRRAAAVGARAGRASGVTGDEGGSGGVEEWRSGAER